MVIHDANHSSLRASQLHAPAANSTHPTIGDYVLGDVEVVATYFIGSSSTGVSSVSSVSPIVTQETESAMSDNNVLDIVLIYIVRLAQSAIDHPQY
jgi:hypothetical protein